MRVVVAGALGEVGSSLTTALRGHGHAVVRASSRAPFPHRPDVVPLNALDLAGVDLVVNAAGRGDRRSQERTGLESAEVLARECVKAGVTGVLLSTTRVLEGAGLDVDGDAPAQATSAYGRANADLEGSWLAHPGLRVLRLANVLCLPQGAPVGSPSPQVELLPWSLVTEALETGTITVRSGPSTTREFVDADDMVSALELMQGSALTPRIVATLPGALLTLAELVTAVTEAFLATGRPAPTARFGKDAPVGPSVRPGWLAAQGWSGTVTGTRVARMVADWLGPAT